MASPARPKQFSRNIELWEVYKTDEENFEPYRPEFAEVTKDEEEKVEEEEEEDLGYDLDSEGFTLHQGEILEVYDFLHLLNYNWESDYSDLSNNGKVVALHYFDDLDKIYKGVRCLLRVAWESPYEHIELDDADEAILGFITELSFNDENMDVGISGMSKLLEQEDQVEFSQMLRSDIIREIIKMAGMKPEVNAEGLIDEIIDYSSASSDDDSDVSGISGDIKALSKKLVGKKKTKASACKVWNWTYSNIRYEGYNDTKKGANGILRDKQGNCCDHAHLNVAIWRGAGGTAKYCRCPGHAWAYFKTTDAGWIYIDTAGNYGCGNTWQGMKHNAVEDKLSW